MKGFGKPEKKKVMCLVAGLPYSGKTTFAKYLSALRHYTLLEQDVLFEEYMAGNARKIIDMMRHRGEIPEERFLGMIEAVALEWYAETAANALRYNAGVVTDSADFLSLRNRAFFLDRVKKQAAISTEVYWMDTNLETCLQRHRAIRQYKTCGIPEEKEKANVREPISEPLLRQWHSIASSPTTEEGFDRIFLVRGITPTEFDIREQK